MGSLWLLVEDIPRLKQIATTQLLFIFATIEYGPEVTRSFGFWREALNMDFYVEFAYLWNTGQANQKTSPNSMCGFWAPSLGSCSLFFNSEWLRRSYHNSKKRNILVLFGSSLKQRRDSLKVTCIFQACEPSYFCPCGTSERDGKWWLIGHLLKEPLC